MTDYRPRVHDAGPGMDGVEFRIVLGGLRNSPVITEIMTPERAMLLAERLIRAARRVSERRDRKDER